MNETFSEIAMTVANGDDYDYIKLMDKHKEELNEKVEELSEILATEKCAEKTEKLRTEITEQVRREFTVEEGTKLFHSSPFISETVEIDGVVFDATSFIAHKGSHDTR